MPDPSALDVADQLRRVDAYLDAAPGDSAAAVDCGPLRAFVSSAPWPYYIRPRPGLDPRAEVSADDVRLGAEVLDRAGQAVSFEWVVELVPLLGPVLREEGYAVRLHPLLVRALDGDGSAPGPEPGAAPGPVPGGLRARLLDAESPDVAVALAVSDVGFGVAGTAIGPEGRGERDEHEPEEALVAYVRGRVRDGRSVLAVLEDPLEGIVATGWHQPLGPATEIVGVATLPSYRRRGAAAAVVEALLVDARRRGCTLALLSADDDTVARVYERVGFTRIGHCGAADPASG